MKLCKQAKQYQYLEKVLENWKYCTTVFNPSMLEWIGCSLCAEFSILSGHIVKKMDNIPDWSDFNF